MNRMFKIITGLLVTVVLLVGCDNAEPETTTESVSTGDIILVKDYEAMAKDLCACMTPMMDLQNKIVEYSAAGDTTAIQNLLNQVEEISVEGDKCVERLEKKHGVVTEENEPKASMAFRKACPEIAALISAGQNMQQ